MQNKKVTVQDIADMLNLSRNTVSKALNNTGTISESTKTKVIQKAIEMGYKQFSHLNTLINSEIPIENKIPIGNKEIALFTCNMPNSSHFGANLLSGFEKTISNLGFRLSMHLIRDTDVDSLSLPINFNPESVDGIICIEMFNHEYNKLICNLNLPTLFIDSSVNNDDSELNADILLMENYHSVYKLTKTLLKNDITDIGFIGDINHCASFNERWKGYSTALSDSGIDIDFQKSILENDKSFLTSSKLLKDKLSLMSHLPQAFICANDFIAIYLIKVLKELSLSVPDDILVCGFDDSAESKIIEPKLTTVNIPSYEMGKFAANLLLSRIENPLIPFRTMHVKTSIIFRGSTGNVNM
ncbi:LacI family transcriptional regulator [Clostridium sartagoforme]|uniref:LacI family transcriptional regulator n=1 Tax=Clostridium sartagoforme TaxID=84031 RepID=A0A4S2DQA4_9CLOT|nr:LacI family DNA-binding transcriptional regulator [Clostridium sartagoforme]TGY43231.1 LacI family transcriptional regulator [Clostridium sartagoforme]